MGNIRATGAVMGAGEAVVEACSIQRQLDLARRFMKARSGSLTADSV
jgi:hypothetical protein